jgi:hypothetical protein
LDERTKCFYKANPERNEVCLHCSSFITPEQLKRFMEEVKNSSK